MGVLPMVWASFLSRTWPGVGGALIIEQRSHWSTLNWRSCPCSGVGRLTDQAQAHHHIIPYLHTRSSGGSGGEERWVASLEPRKLASTRGQAQKASINFDQREVKHQL